MENYLQIQEVFNKHVKNYDEWYEKNKYIYLSEVEALKKAIPQDKKGLEIGVGTGRFFAGFRMTMLIFASSIITILTTRSKKVNR
jgi:ubiquinone/menaquinone biosynthesis C-methylase UbiE